jgi:hypothetical protein
MKYILMHKKLPVAEVDIDEHNNIITKIVDVYEKEHLPLGVVKSNGQIEKNFLSDWWRGRVIPSSRPGLRDSLEKLHVSSVNELPLKGFGLSLSDQYWACPKDSKIDWENINYFNNSFSLDVGDILFGKDSKNNKLDLNSPDNTSDGWLQKRWVILNNKRNLLKAGSPPYYQEPANEALASMICQRLNIPHVSYRIVIENNRPLSICEDFINSDTELISAWYIKQLQNAKNSSSEYQHYLDCCNKIELKDTKKYLNQMLTLDYIVVNTDRHYNNFGAIRYAENLEWISHAPIYDSGTSLWHDIDIDNAGLGGPMESKPFKKNHYDQIKLVKDFSWLDIKKIDNIDEEFAELLKPYPTMNKTRKDGLCIALQSRVKRLKDIVIEQSHEAKRNTARGFDLDR